MKAKDLTFAALGLVGALFLVLLAMSGAPGRNANAQVVPPQCGDETIDGSINQAQLPRCIEIFKVTDPAGDDQLFDFFADTPGTDEPFQLQDNGVPAEIDVLQDGIYVITEFPSPGWVLEDISCTNVDGFTVDVDLEAGSVTLTTINPQVTFMAVCTFTNVEEGCGITIQPRALQVTPCLEIIKQTDPDGSNEDFPFEITGDFNDDFELEDDESQVYTTGNINLQLGDQITITEDVPDGWELVDIECDGDGLDFDVNVGDNEVTIDVVGGDEIVFGSCTFFNEEIDDDEDEGPPPNLGGLFGGLNTAQQNRERAGVIAATPQPAPAVVRPPSTGDGGLLP